MNSPVMIKGLEIGPRTLMAVRLLSPGPQFRQSMSLSNHQAIRGFCRNFPRA